MTTVDVAVVGAGAAGLVAALAARGAVAPDGELGGARSTAPRVLLVDGQPMPGRKILISGGGRCNVTNARVTEQDMVTTSPTLVRNLLRSFGVDRTRTLFASAGVELREEALGKLFPVSDRARDVLEALLTACERAAVETRFGQPVARVAPRDDGRWQVDDVIATRVVLATGGRSVPATGSTGFGLDVAAGLGHDLVPTVPALAPLLGRGNPDLAGLTVPAIVRVVDRHGREHRRAAGSLLFTHRGVTGPAALDVSEAVERAHATATPVRVLADLWTLADPTGALAGHLDAPKLPGCCLADPPVPAAPGEVDRDLRQVAARDGRVTTTTAVSARVPRRLAQWLVGSREGALGQLPRDQRREVAARLADADLRVDATGGYAKAEVTAGGVRLDELDRHRLESRLAPGLHLCGEVCDVTGRLGGFNFQWAWSSGVLAGRAAGRA